jgi:hypothetical protein
MAEKARDWLTPGGCFAVAGSSSLWSGTAPWLAVAAEVVRDFTPHQGRASVASAQAPAGTHQTHQEVLSDSGFTDVEEFQFPTPQHWTLDSFMGYLNSLSMGSSVARSGTAGAFESTLRERLLAYHASGEYEETVAFYFILAHSPGPN